MQCRWKTNGVQCEDWATASRKAVSKYCRIHRKMARAAWRERVERDKQEREARRANFRTLVREAHSAGLAAAQEEDSRVPPCGFAWVKTPGNRAFGRWAKEHCGWRRDNYAGGVQFWISEFGQSYAQKLAYARAYAAHLVAAGVEAYASGRLD